MLRYRKVHVLFFILEAYQCFTIDWFGWLLVEILSTSNYSLHRAIIFALALTLGFTVVLILGLRSERKFVKNIDEIINQIER